MSCLHLYTFLQNELNTPLVLYTCEILFLENVHSSNQHDPNNTITCTVGAVARLFDLVHCARIYMRVRYDLGVMRAHF